MDKQPGRYPSATISGFVLGAVFLAAAIVMRLFNPGFTGFFERSQSSQLLPLWLELLGVAALNFVIAGVALYTHRQKQKPPRR